MLEEKTVEQTAPITEPQINDVEVLGRLRRIRVANIWGVRIFLTLFFAVFVIAFIIPLRPTYSESEKRELEKFPKFSVASLLSGEYFTGIDNWYSDTFPERELFTEFNAKMTGFYGVGNVKIHGVVEKGDDIPEIPSDAEAEDSSSQTQSSSDTNNLKGETPQPQPQEPPLPTTQTLGALLINGDTAYEYYNFNQSTSEQYSYAVARAGNMLAGKANVYDILVPTSMGITAPDDLVAGINTSNQNDAINYMYSLMGNNVVRVPIFDLLKSKKNEYIYFRTDHHWTANGAYYAYSELMNKMGKTPCSLDSYIKYEFPQFLGSFYNSSDKLPQLTTNPDTVYAYAPPQTNSLAVYSKSAVWYNANIISDMSAVSPSNKYLTFIKGDNPLCAMTNPNLNDGSCCIVIKESFGNAFVPFLVPHYQYVYVVDYRYIASVDSRGLIGLRAETGATDIVFINNVSATRNKALVNAIDYYVR